MTDILNNKLKTYDTRPYYDDYDVNDKFLQILFRPGLAVQARELTQLQSILQDQIARVGSHFFDNGARVLSGETKLNNKIQYIKMKPDFSLAINGDYIGGTITLLNGNTDTTLKAKITHLVDKTSTDPVTFYVEYISSADTVGTVKNSFSVDTINPINNDYIRINYINTDTKSSQNSINLQIDEVGYGAIYSINRGIYYINARFVLVDSHSVVISKYTDITASTDTLIVGLIINDRIVYPEDNPILYDNAIGSTNESAPGATRYTIDLQLSLKPTDAELLKNFVEIVQIKLGTTLTKPNVTDYTKTFLETFAKRTYDESGDYIINDFLLDVKEYVKEDGRLGIISKHDLLGIDVNLPLPTDTDSINKITEAQQKVNLNLDAGKAYVRGYEVETVISTDLLADKARTTANLDQIFVSTPYESYVDCSWDNGGVLPSNFFVDTAPLLFRSSSGTTLFRATPKHIKHIGGNFYRIYFFILYPENPNINTPLSDIHRVNLGSANFTITPLPNEGITINTANSSGLYKLPFSIVKNIEDILFSYYDVIQYNCTVVNILNIPNADNSISTNTADFVISNGISIIIPSTITTDLLSNTLTIHGVFPMGLYTIICKKSKNSYSPRKKIKTQITTGFTTTRSNFYRLMVNLGVEYRDVISIESITDSSGKGNYLDYFYLDNGQRDTHYGIAALIPKPNVVVPDTILVKFTYFEHTDGDFFTVDSYDIPFTEIPYYKNEFLGNYVDTRPSGYGSMTTARKYISPDDKLIVTYNVYLPRKDKIIVNKNKEFLVLKGIPSFNPEFQKDADDAITLYELSYPAYTFKTSDIKVKKLNYKRYTMKDLTQLERRIEDLEYYTSLSLLEADANNKNFADKFKSGFIVDNFENITASDSTSSLYTVSLDFSNNQMRPSVLTNAINMELASKSNIRVHDDDIVTIQYTETEMIKQPYATTLERIQPFAQYRWQGKVVLNPTFDNWVTTRYVDITLDNGAFDAGNHWGVNEAKNKILNNVYDSVGRFFTGQSINSANTKNNRLDTAGNAATSGNKLIGWDSSKHMNAWARPIVSTQTQYVGNRVLDVGLLPYIRSKKIEFSITGLKPYTKVSPYFDGVPVSKYCSKDDIWEYTWKYPNEDESLSNDWQAWYEATATTPHPMISDGAGDISGYFWIPNSDTARFKTGIRKFVVSDVVENPSTEANADYIASGVNVTIQNIFVTTRFIDYETIWYDPVAQSFLVDSPEGAFITSIDIYFGDTVITNEDDVKVQIRSMVNGYPSDKIVTEKVLTASQILAQAPNPNIQKGYKDGLLPTRFTFTSPVYLESKNEYCFVVISNSTSLTIWTSRLGEKEHNTGEYINKQPYLGSMFKSQNSKTWTAEQLQDIKFNINKANFNINIPSTVNTVNLVNPNELNGETDPFFTILGKNPFYITTNAVDIIYGGSGYTDGNYSVTILDTANNSIPTSITVSGGKIIQVSCDVVSAAAFSGTLDYTNAISAINGLTSTGNKAIVDFVHFNKIKVSHKNHGFNINNVVTYKYVESNFATKYAPALDDIIGIQNVYTIAANLQSSTMNNNNHIVTEIVDFDTY